MCVKELVRLKHEIRHLTPCLLEFVAEAPVKGEPFEQITAAFQNDILPGRSSSFVTLTTSQNLIMSFQVSPTGNHPISLLTFLQTQRLRVCLLIFMQLVSVTLVST